MKQHDRALQFLYGIDWATVGGIGRYWAESRIRNAIRVLEGLEPQFERPENWRPPLNETECSALQAGAHWASQMPGFEKEAATLRDMLESARAPMKLSCCPFCGGKAYMLKDYIGLVSRFKAECLAGCVRQRDWSPSEEAAITAWNTRTVHTW